MNLPIETQNKAVNQQLIEANSDAEAFALWVKTKGAKSGHTRTAYAREQLRLLHWLDDRGLRARELTLDLVHQFYATLANPPSRWIRPVKPHKESRLRSEQTMTRGLSAASLNYSRTVLNNLFTWLQNAQYIQGNPFTLSAAPATLTHTEQARYLTVSTWQWLTFWLKNMPTKTLREQHHKARCQWLFMLFYHTGLRIDEAASGIMGDFVKRDDQWRLRIIGKRNKVRFVSVNSTLVAELHTYRRYLGLAPQPSPGEQTPLIGRLGSVMTPVTARAIRLIVTAVGHQAARDTNDESIAHQLMQMSPHWLRHTNATHRMIAGASLMTTQDELGHADIRTTRIYAKAQDDERAHDAEKLSSFAFFDK